MAEGYAEELTAGRDKEFHKYLKQKADGEGGREADTTIRCKFTVRLFRGGGVGFFASRDPARNGARLKIS